MNTSRTLAIIMTAFTLLALGACGGGGGGGTAPPPVTPPPPPPTGGISGNGIAVGPITTFGSVEVNGVHYDTSNTSFSFDDNPSTEDFLEIGDIITVKGTINDDGVTGTAESVSSDDEVTGPIASINKPAGQFRVLGQLVQVTLETTFEDTVSIDTLNIGDIVEVHGYLKVNDPNGIDIEATRIENKSGGLIDDEVHGTVSGRTDSTFMLGDLLVDYSMALLDNSFPGGLISDGDFVEVKGNSFVDPNTSVLTLKADSVELEDRGIAGDDGDHAEIQGFITDFDATNPDEPTFVVAGTPIVTNSSTTVENGVMADLGNNIKVEVEGTLDTDGITLIAGNIEIRRSKAVRIVALVDSIAMDSNGNSIDPIVMLGITITTGGSRFDDKSDLDVRIMNIGNIQLGDYIEIRGVEFPVDSNSVLATIVERDDLDTKRQLQGFVESVTDPTLTILGVTIDTTGAVFRNVDDSVLSSVDFFGTDRTGVLVKAKWDGDPAGTIVATEVELELEL